MLMPMKIEISIPLQTLELHCPAGLVRTYPVSTSKFGVGSEEGSYRTPLGAFRIAEKIGEGAPLGAVFKSRIPTGEIAGQGGEEDLVLTRILRLDGLDPENANTLSRYIYIHGTNHEALIGQPASHGCVRLRNADMVDLFNQVSVEDRVFIRA
jgi:L,D-transpeptidase YbiS